MVAKPNYVSYRTCARKKNRNYVLQARRFLGVFLIRVFRCNQCWEAIREILFSQLWQWWQKLNNSSLKWEKIYKWHLRFFYGPSSSALKYYDATTFLLSGQKFKWNEKDAEIALVVFIRKKIDMLIARTVHGIHWWMQNDLYSFRCWVQHLL